MDQTEHMLEEPLAIRPERIDPKYLIDGKAPIIEATPIAAVLAGRGPRGYRLSGLPAPTRIDLWNGAPAGDGDRLRDLTEDLLAPEAPAPEAPREAR